MIKQADLTLRQICLNFIQARVNGNLSCKLTVAFQTLSKPENFHQIDCLVIRQKKKHNSKFHIIFLWHGGHFTN